jgi:RNA polymerase sigma factor (sigma-70 family)
MPTFQEIYHEHKKMVYNLCLNYLQNMQDAEEATQDIFVKIYGKISSFEGKSSIKTWIYRIAINHCLDCLKAQKRQKRVALFKNIFNTENQIHYDPPDFNHPGVQLEDREALESLYKKINKLPANQKTAVILKYLDDLPQREIAVVMDISEKAVESLLQRAKQQLKK